MKKNESTIIPTMRYKDAPAAIDWLCKAFGFEKHLVVPGENGTIAHAQLKMGNAMIMLGSENDDEYGKLLGNPLDHDGLNTQASYVFVEEIRQHYQQALAAGAKIVMELKEEDYGGAGYSCQDPEGYLWNFGSYNPWTSE